MAKRVKISWQERWKRDRMKQRDEAVMGEEAATEDEDNVKNVENEHEMQENIQGVVGKKKPGRKPKAVMEAENKDEMQGNIQGVVGKKKPGRKPKAAMEGENKHEMQENIQEVVVKKRLGRKPKAVMEAENKHEMKENIQGVVGKKKPGRKPKAVMEGENKHEMQENMVGKKKPGRRPKAVMEGENKHQMQENIQEVVGKKKPGRKPKAVTEGENKHEMQENIQEVVVKKKPGRKPKAVMEGGAIAEAGKKRSSSAEEQGQRKRRKLSVTGAPSDRPSRERKSIDRFVLSTEKERVTEVQILQGSGTPLKDIPNVAYSLGKRSEADKVLGSLHSLLYGGRRIKASFVKNSVLQFSGFVWGKYREKGRAKVKERLERLTKESLIDISNLLDIKVYKTTIKKEELIAKILEFLESPYKTTDVLLEEQENALQGRKRKSRSPGKRTRQRLSKNLNSKDTPTKRRHKKPKFLKEGGVDEDASKETDEDPDESENSEEKVKPAKKLARSKVAPIVASKQKGTTKTNVKRKNKKTSSKLPSGSNVQDRSPLKFTKVEKKRKKAEKETKRKTEVSKGIRKVQPKSNVKEKFAQIAGKKQYADKKIKKGKNDSKGNHVAKRARHVQAFPSESQLGAEIYEFLRHADVSTVTFTDIVKRLEAKFRVSF